MGIALSVGLSYVASGGFTTAFGWALASLALAPEVKGPRIKNQEVQYSEVGMMIPIFFGTVRTAGNIIWSKKIKETRRRRRGGKGFGTRTNYHYYFTGAIMFGQECDQILAIWANNKKIYDYNGGAQKGYTLVYDGVTGAWESEKLRVYTGTETQLPDPIHEATEGVGKTPAYRGRTYIVVEDFLCDDYGGQPPTFTALIKRNKNNCQDIAEEICDWAFIESGDTDFEYFSNFVSDGFMLSEHVEAKRWLDILQTSCSASIVEYDWKLRSRSRAEDSIRTINSNEINFYVTGEEKSRTERLVTYPLDMPYRVQLEYIDKTRDYNRNSAQFSRQVVESRKQETVSMPMVFDGATARQLAQTVLVTRWIERRTYNFSLGMGCLDLAPGDIITIPTKTGLADVRITEVMKQFFGPMLIKAVHHDATAYAQPALPSPDPDLPPSEVLEYELPQYVFVELHALRDQDADLPGFYAGFGVSRTGKWKPVVMESPGVLDEIGNGEEPGYVTFESPAAIGVVTNALPETDALYWDDTTEIYVDLPSGTLSSCTDDDVLDSSTNACAVGREIIQFVNAEFISENTETGVKQYKLTRLLRGRKGTEVYMGSHVINEKFMLLDDRIKHLRYPISYLGQYVNHEAVWGAYTLDNPSLGGTIDITFRVEGYSIKPFAVGALRPAYQTNGDVIWKFQPRTRLVEKFFYTGSSPADPVYPDTDNYVLEIWSEDELTLLRSVDLTSVSEFTYTVAMQTTDGLTDADSVHLKAYRLSSVSCLAMPYNRGYEAEATFALTPAYPIL